MCTSPPAVALHWPFLLRKEVLEDHLKRHKQVWVELRAGVRRTKEENLARMPTWRVGKCFPGVSS